MSELKKSLNNKLVQLIGQTVMYKARQHTFNNFHFDGEKIYIGTNIDLIIIDAEEAETILTSEFLPVSNNKSGLIIAPKNKSVLQSLNDSNIVSTLQGNIDRLKTDDKFIPQAMAINYTVSTMLNLAKIEMLSKKLMPE